MEEWMPSSGHNHVKAAKEEFVSNLDGTSPWELLCIASTVPLGLYVFLSLSTARSQRQGSNDAPAPRQQHLFWIIIIEFLSFWFPAILCQTVWSFPWAIVYFTALLILSSAYYHHAAAKNIIRVTVSEKKEDEGSGQRKNISTSEEEDDRAVAAAFGVTIYRAALLCLTCVAILAVDFPLFPRRLAKTEVYGYGWMDLGAASFVIAAGIVSPPAKRRQGGIPADGAVVPRGGGKKALLPLQRILPVLFMGTLRLVTHKNIDYQEHASEYGVHWNFFFTLAVLTLLSSSMMPLSHNRPTLLLPCIVMVLYQVALLRYGGQEWIETAPRYCSRDDDDDRGGILLTRSLLCDLWVANREGILGCIGYGSLFFVSEWVASVAIWTHRVNLWSVVSVLGLVWWMLDHAAIGINVSRRSTNVTFCVWALLVNTLQLASIQTLLDYFFTRKTTATRMQPPPLLDALNRNGLLAFVLANLLTGLVNLTVDTLHTSYATALWILILYLAAVGGLAVALERVKTIVRRGKEGGGGGEKAARKHD
jgi:glucosaminylphosphatidylinositol acyltransferase